MVSASACNEGILPWPECLGTFDEESCRFFLRELGQRIVQFYPFSVGMEEVFTQIVDKYGLQGAPDAMSVLQELLEDDAAADGAGDDGDIWRSWRHSWRHRNNNPYNPYVPRVRGQILPPPTHARIRLLKATNFATLQLAQKRSRTTSFLRSPRASSTSLFVHSNNLDTVYEVVDTTPLCVSASVDDYHQILLDQTPGNRGTGRAQKHSPAASSGSSQPPEENVLLPSRRYNPKDIVLGSPRRSMPAPTRRHGFPFDLLSPRRKTSPDPPNHYSNGAMPKEAQLSPGRNSNGSGCNSRSPITQDTNFTTSDVIEKTPRSLRFGRNHDNRYSLPSDFGSTDAEATPRKRRAVHRQARLIDGALFHGKSRKGNFTAGENSGTNSPVKAVPETSSHRSSWQSTQEPPRTSWLHNALARFRGEHSRKSKQPKLRKQHSILVSCTSNSPQITRSSMPAQQQTNAHIPEMRQTTPLRGLGFNGACDEYSNKPLPLSPAEQGSRPSIQSETQRTFFGRNKETSSSAGLDLDPSFASSGITQIRDKDELRSLVSATMSGPQELSPQEKALKYRFSSSTTRSEPPSPKSFTTSAQRNWYRDSGEPSTSELATYRLNGISSTVWPFRGPQDSIEQDEKRSTQEGEDMQPMRSPSKHASSRQPEEEEERDRRGRRPATPASPSKLRFGLKSTPPKTPRPRSRSPVKKLIGMVKSMSTNQITNEPSPPKTNTPVSTNKRRWKELSHKFRHGFLTADLEQLEQEDMMEQYAMNATDRANDGIRIITPPASRRRPVFPVSIKSSGQSKLWSELEYMLIETCNSFLKEELENGRLSRDSVLRVKHQWQARNRPQIIEFYYDQTTQYDLIIANLQSVQLYSDYAQDAIMLNSVLHQWKILIRELSVKTLCMPDSIVRRWLHDGRRVLELLGASQVSLSHLDRLSSLCLAVIGSAEKERAKARQRTGATDTHSSHHRSASDGSQRTLSMHEHNLLRGQEAPPPPLPMPTSMKSASQKVSPQERRVSNARAQAKLHNERSGQDGKHFVFTYGHKHPKSPSHGHSRSLGQGDDRGRFVFD